MANCVWSAGCGAALARQSPRFTLHITFEADAGRGGRRGGGGGGCSLRLHAHWPSCRGHLAPPLCPPSLSLSLSPPDPPESFKCLWIKTESRTRGKGNQGRPGEMLRCQSAQQWNSFKMATYVRYPLSCVCYETRLSLYSSIFQRVFWRRSIEPFSL